MFGLSSEMGSSQHKIRNCEYPGIYLPDPPLQLCAGVFANVRGGQGVLLKMKSCGWSSYCAKREYSPLSRIRSEACDLVGTPSQFAVYRITSTRMSLYTNTGCM